MGWVFHSRFYLKLKYKGNDVIECSCDIYKCWPKTIVTVGLTAVFIKMFPLGSPGCSVKVCAL